MHCFNRLPMINLPKSAGFYRFFVISPGSQITKLSNFKNQPVYSNET